MERVDIHSVVPPFERDVIAMVVLTLSVQIHE
jgi:hypothetical protein